MGIEKVEGRKMGKEEDDDDVMSGDGSCVFGGYDAVLPAVSR
uniref:Uncharacterized protein n=1 Tax=Cucumis melo subsp. melo TaxID=412675 RepID=E5GBT3_CUCME|nr:hypothetical protein [Cucumis melo subsp. melo]